MAEKSLRVSDRTDISMPVRNLLSIVIAVSIGVWSYFEITARLNRLETFKQLVQKDLEQGLRELKVSIEKNNEFRIKWPRGELGQPPADGEQFMMIEHLGKQVEKIQTRLEEGMSNGVNIKRLQTDMVEVREAVEKLKDKQRGMVNK